MESNEIKLSIIIPVYNTEKYIKRCMDTVILAVESIKNQVEVIVINDGSTDASEQIILENYLIYPFVKYYKKANGGLSDVKNYGLKRANGEFVIFLDSDDFIEPKMYVEMLNKAEQENSDIVVCDIKLVYDDEKKNTIWSCTIDSRKDIFAKVIDMSMMPASWNKIVKRELYKGLFFPVGINNEDVAVTPIVLARAKKISVVNKPYYNYYQRAGSIQNSEFNEKRFVILETVKMCTDQLNEVEDEKGKKIKGSLYMHQVLALALYPIREQKIRLRYYLLKKYMTQVEINFPDIWENDEVKESTQWEGRGMQYFRKISYGLLERQLYFLTCLFWSLCNFGLLIVKSRHNKRKSR